MAEAASMISVAILPSATLRRVVLIANSLARRVLVLLPLGLTLSTAPGSSPDMATATNISNMTATSVLVECRLRCTVVRNCGGGLDTPQVEHRRTVEVIVPPILVSHGLGEHSVPWPLEVEVGSGSAAYISLMVAFDVSSKAVEVLVPHPHVGHVDNEPRLRSVCVVKSSHQLAVVVEDLGVNGTKEQEGGSQHSE